MLYDVFYSVVVRGDIVVVCCQAEGSHTSPPHSPVQYKVARQKLSLSLIIGSWCAIIDIPAAVELRSIHLDDWLTIPTFTTEFLLHIILQLVQCVEPPRRRQRWASL